MDNIKSAMETAASRQDVRDFASKRLQELKDNARQQSTIYAWHNPDRILDSDASHYAKMLHYNGFVHIPAFYNDCDQMKSAMSTIVATQWHNVQETFGTDDKQNTARGDYFLESADRVHFFAEPEALDEKGELLPQYTGDEKIKALNKVGHGLHLERAFYDYCQSDKLNKLVRDDFGYEDPVVPQSMYIFKQAATATASGTVHSHQDSTFLYTTPRQTCLGLWLALDSATLERGCLWVRPRSHIEPVRRQYKRNVAHFGQESIEKRSNIASTVDSNDATVPKFVMDVACDDASNTVEWDGSIPKLPASISKDNTDKKDNINDSDDAAILPADEQEEYAALLYAGFIPVECKPGDLLAFVGTLDHLSMPNRDTTQARHTFQLHLVEGPRAGIEWSKYNWLQYDSNSDNGGVNGTREFVRLGE